MNLPSLLYRHYHAAHAAYALTDCACCPDEHAADKRAVDCAALHIGLDAMSRIQAKRTPKFAGYAPIARRDAAMVREDLRHRLDRHRRYLWAALGRHPWDADHTRALECYRHYAMRL